MSAKKFYKITNKKSITLMKVLFYHRNSLIGDLDVQQDVDLKELEKILERSAISLLRVKILHNGKRRFLFILITFHAKKNCNKEGFEEM